MKLVLEFSIRQEGPENEARKTVIWRVVEERGLASSFRFEHNPNRQQLWLDGVLIGDLIHVTVAS